MKALLTATLAVSLSAFLPKDKLTGRWQTAPSDKGNVTGVVFKADKTFEGYVNRKPFVTGKYTLKDSTFRFTDNGCLGAEGVYRLRFFSHNDSLRFIAISDTCSDRKAGMERLVMGRVRK